MRKVTDEGSRVWACRQDGDESGKRVEGQDVDVLCTTATVTVPVKLRLGWQWATMSENGLARMLVLAAPIPRKVTL